VRAALRIRCDLDSHPSSPPLDGVFMVDGPCGYPWCGSTGRHTHYWGSDQHRSEFTVVTDYQGKAVSVTGGLDAVVPVNLPSNRLAVAAGYEPLARVLDEALAQSQTGKGRERHSTGQPFLEQPIAAITRTFGTGFALGQAAKKMEESQRLEPVAARRELLGAIVYLAMAVLHSEELEERAKITKGP